MFGISKLYIYGALALIVVVAAGTVFYKIREGGYDAAITKVEKNNGEARKRAIEGAADVDACYAADGVWSRSTGLCTEPQGGN